MGLGVWTVFSKKKKKMFINSLYHVHHPQQWGKCKPKQLLRLTVTPVRIPLTNNLKEMLVRFWGKELLVGLQTDPVSLSISVENSLKAKSKPSKATPWHTPEGFNTPLHSCSPGGLRWVWPGQDYWLLPSFGPLQGIFWYYESWPSGRTYFPVIVIAALFTTVREWKWSQFLSTY